MQNELKPCPFCHNPAYINQNSLGWQIKCICGARSPLETKKEFLIEIWNAIYKTLWVNHETN